MAYQTGTSTDTADLLDKLRVFAIASGWTINNFGDRTAGTAPRKALQMTKGGISASFLSDSAIGTAVNPGPYILTYGHDTYAVGGGTENQANGSTKTQTNAMIGPFQAYHFFSDNGDTNPYLYVVVETSGGTFKHFGVGRIEGMGEVVTGCFAYGCNWNYQSSPDYASDANTFRHSVPFDTIENNNGNGQYSTYIRGDSDSLSPRWYASYTTNAQNLLSGGVRGTGSGSSAAGAQIPMNWGIMQAGASERTGRTILQNCFMAGARQSGVFSPLGWPPNIRWVNLRYMDPGATLVLGSDTWKVFPVIRKNGGAGQPNSALYGYAYKVN